MVHYFDRSRFIMGGGCGKQKVVIKLSLENARKRTKATKALIAAAGIAGVISTSLDVDIIEVLGDGLDVLALVCVLRKKLGYADLISSTRAILEEGYSDDDGTNSSTDSLQSPVSICRCFPV